MPRLLPAGLACLLSLAPSIAWTQKVSAVTPTITAAVISVDGSTLFVEGSGFGRAPTVTLGGFFLGGVSVNLTGTQPVAPVSPVAPCGPAGPGSPCGPMAPGSPGGPSGPGAPCPPSVISNADDRLVPGPAAPTNW